MKFCRQSEQFHVSAKFPFTKFLLQQKTPRATRAVGSQWMEKQMLRYHRRSSRSGSSFGEIPSTELPLSCNYLRGKKKGIEQGPCFTCGWIRQWTLPKHQSLTRPRCNSHSRSCSLHTRRTNQPDPASIDGWNVHQ